MLKLQKGAADLNSGRVNDETELQALKKASDIAGLKDFISNRVTSSEYHEKLNERNQLRLKLESLALKYNVAKGYSAREDGKRKVGTRVEIREAMLAHRDVYEELMLIVTELDQYREITARAAAIYSSLRDTTARELNTFIEFTGTELGDLIVTGQYESGSDEWHQQRADGIGGSDIGPIMRVDPEYASVNYRQVLLAKLGEEDPNATVVDETDETTAIGRGNAWENAILQRVADENPDLRIAYCKSSWAGRGADAWKRANFDGLILDESGTPRGVVEIKTGSYPEKWGPIEHGLWGVPAGYRKQVLWYATLAGLEFGKIVALIDDHDYREYDFVMSDPAVRAEVAEMMKATEDFWKMILKKRDDKKNGVTSSKPRSRGFGKTPDYRKIADILSAYSGESPTKTRRDVLTAIADREEELGRALEGDEHQAVLLRLFADHNPATRSKPIYGVDIETSKASPRTGRIIETGITELRPGGEPKIVYSELHGVPDHVVNGAGVGFVEVHGITVDDLAGKPHFDDPTVQAAILSYLKSGVMVAHNLGFEDRFFTANLAGYAEARESGEIVVLDTRVLATYLMPDSADSSLNSFAEDNGVPYEGAHAAATDSLMMIKALQNLQTTLHTHGKFVSKRVTEAARRRAIKAAIEAEATR